ncbi:MAG: hypothetical protein KDB53_14510, partial [Planctomycetes bacterium]|nr:hypothetical protein [Planctomycetota bacterium]
MSEWRQLGGKGGVGLMVREDAIALMKSLELDSLDRALTFQGGEVVVQGRRRTVRRIATANGPALFLKQSYRGGRGSLVRGLLRRGRRKSSSVIE